MFGVIVLLTIVVSSNIMMMVNIRNEARCFVFLDNKTHDYIVTRWFENLVAKMSF